MTDVGEHAGTFGCVACYGDDAEACWQHFPYGYDEDAILADDSHFSVGLRRCRICSQTFVLIFTEFVDWAGGDDAQHFTIMPVSTAEAAALTESRLDVHAIGTLGDNRRHLHRDWPTGVEQARVYWASGRFHVVEGH